MQVSELWRFPVKSMQGERLDAVSVTSAGMEGDRAWALFDAETGLHLTARRDPDLLFAAARVEPGVGGPEVVVTLPDGTETTDDATLSAWLGRDVALRRAAPDSVGTYEIQLDESDEGSWVQWSGGAGSFHDSTVSQISLVSVTAFGSWDFRRFRTNVILDQDGDVGLVGHKVQIGSVGLDVTKQIDRCVMTTRPQPALGQHPALERDLEVLKVINRDHDTFLAVGAMIHTAGNLAVGDQVTVADRAES
jgi:uncharacterized protein YcbX